MTIKSSTVMWNWLLSCTKGYDFKFVDKTLACDCLIKATDCSSEGLFCSTLLWYNRICVFL